MTCLLPKNSQPVTDNFCQLIEGVQALETRLRQDYEDSLDHVALPGTRVWVLHDGRRGWMHGVSGTVGSTDEEWAWVNFSTGIKRFKLERLSRAPAGMDCRLARIDSALKAAPF
jgi:hypothetical protein